MIYFNKDYSCSYYEKSSGGGTRTPDKVVNSHLLYQLSYSGIINFSFLWLSKSGRNLEPFYFIGTQKVSFFIFYFSLSFSYKAVLILFIG